jgi:predicted methyltransferase
MSTGGFTMPAFLKHHFEGKNDEDQVARVCIRARRARVCASVAPASARADDAASKAAIDAALKEHDRPKKDFEEDDRRKAREVLTFAAIKPGMHVADMFSAGGYYTELLSRIVGPKGKVIAYNNKEYAGFAEKDIATRYADNRLPNVEQVTAPVEAAGFKPNSIDAVLFIMSYHDLYWRPKDGSWPATDPRRC